MEPVKAQQDPRLYRIITLHNDLQCLLIHDPHADTAAAAMDVHVGHFSDPQHIPGLAHLLEHMLFRGTQTYPDISSYEAFLSSHGGQSNAYTATENTNFHFTVNAEFLSEALHRFSQFFICPLFNEQGTETEILAVDSENSKNLQSDQWRLYQLKKSTSTDNHPFSKFGTGNKETLLNNSSPEQVREFLINFYKKYYSANLMKLCVLGRDGLDELESVVREQFTAIPNHERPTNRFPGMPFDNNVLGKIHFVAPVKNLKILSIEWQWPSVIELYKAKPYSVIAHLLGHESEGSILSLLKNRGWATDLTAGVSEKCLDFTLFSVSIDLTQEGMENYYEVLEIIFQYIHTIQEISDVEWDHIFDEVAKVSAMNFRFKGKEDPISYAVNCSKNMHCYGSMEVLSGPWLYTEFKPELLRKFTGLLAIKNARIDLISQDFEEKADMSEPWYETRYSVHTIDEEWLLRLSRCERNENLFPPQVNEFIASDFTLVIEEKEESSIQLIREDQTLKLWYKPDTVYRVPKLNVIASMYLPHVGTSPENEVCAQVFKKLLQNSLNEYAYSAEICGLQYSLDVTSMGFQLIIKGYNEKLSTLLLRVLSRMRQLESTEEQFKVVRLQLKRNYENFYLDQPYQQAFYNQNICLHNNRWHNDSLLETITDLSFEDYVYFHSRLFRRGFVEILAHGNVTRAGADDISNLFISALDYKPCFLTQFPERRVVSLKPGMRYFYNSKVYNPNEENSAVLCSVQIGPDTVMNCIGIELVSQVASEPCFTVLRTEEQLGYIVASGVDFQRGILSLRIIVQSSKHDPKFLDERVNSFLSGTLTRLILEELNVEEFRKHARNLIATKMEMEKKLSDETSKYFAEISKRRYAFDRKEQEVDALKLYSIEDLRDFYREHFTPQSRKQICARVYGANSEIADGDDGSTIISDYVSFRKSNVLYECLV